MAIKEIFVFVAFFSVLCGFGDFVNIQCDYGTNFWTAVGSVYQCKLQNALNIKSKESAVINSVNGILSSGKSNADVTGFYSDNNEIEYFPRNLENIFTNLKMIWIQNGHLKEIQQSNLRPFSKLMRLDFDYSDIEFLENGLFAYNPELVLISFGFNKIIHIGTRVFDNLVKLTYLYLEQNKCINMNGINNQTAMREVISEAKLNCSSYLGLDKDLQKLENSLLCINSETLPMFDQNLQNLQKRFQNSNFSQYWQLKERFQAITSLKSKNIWTIKDKVTSIETVIANSKSEVLNQISSLKTDLGTIKSIQTSTDDKVTKVMTEIQLIKSQAQTCLEKTDNLSKVSQYLTKMMQEISDIKSTVNSKSSVIRSNSSINDYKNLTIQDFSKYILIGLGSILCLFNIVLIIVFKRFSM